MRHLLTVVLFVSIGCGGNEVSISGNDPAGDAEEVTNAICEYEADCGSWTLSLSSNNGVTECTATKKTVSFSTCKAEEYPDILEDFQCAGTLSPSEANTLERCVNWALDRSCVTQSQMDAYCAEIERGVEPPPPGGEPPAECAALGDIFDRCMAPRTGNWAVDMMRLARTAR